jgi:membrane-associated phospholipid phosphatase
LAITYLVFIAIFVADRAVLLNVDAAASKATFDALAPLASFFIVVTNLGAAVFWGVLSALLFFYGRRTSKRPHKRAGALLFLGMLLDLGVNFVLKTAISRPRPEWGLSFVSLEGEIGSSFPSGHTERSFLATAILGSFYPRWRPALVAVAIVVAISRVSIGAHFWLDVLVAALNGVTIGLIWLGLPWDRIMERLGIRSSKNVL